MIDDLIYSTLTDAGLNIAGVDAVVMPQQCEFPRVRYQYIGSDLIPEHGRGLHCEIPQFQVDVYSHSLKECKELAVLVKQVMVDATAFTCSLIGDSGDDYEPDTKLFRFSQDFKVWSN